MSAWWHNLCVLLSYGVLIFFCIGTIHDFVKFMTKGMQPTDRVGQWIVTGFTLVLVLILILALVFVGSGWRS